MFFKEDLKPGDPWYQKIDFIIFHVFILGLIFIIYRQFGLIDLFPLSEKLQQWDTGWYDNIRINGYTYSELEQSNSGFFPLFPYLWKWSGLSVVGITFFNALVSIVAFILLYQNFNFKKSEFLIAISIPSVFFLLVPYTESLFFLFSTVFLIGLKKKNLALIWAGLFFASITRSTGLFFLPAIGLIIFLESNNQDLFSLKTLRKLVLYSLPIFLGIAVVVVWQYLETGVWFAYFKAQSNHWFRGLSFPALPLSVWNYPKILWLDALAFLAGFFAFLMVIKRIINRVNHKGSENLEVIISEGYLCAVFISLILFNPKNMESGLTEISGANRYIFATPFFFLMLKNFLCGKYNPVRLAFLVVPFFWLLFNIYNPTDILIFSLLSVYVILYFLLDKTRFRSLVSMAIYLAGMLLQFYIVGLFLRGEWVG